MRVLITGAGGMLGTEATLFYRSAGHEVIPTSRKPIEGFMALDVTEPGAAQSVIRETKPDLVLHCAANTNVDGCERDPDAAYRGNAFATWSVAVAAEAMKSSAS